MIRFHAWFFKNDERSHFHSWFNINFMSYFFQICLSRNLYHGMCCKNSSTWFNNKQVYIFTRSLELVGFYRHYIGVSIQGYRYFKNYFKNLYIVAWIFKKNHEEKINFKMWVIDIWLQDWVKSYLIFSHNPLSKTILQ